MLSFGELPRFREGWIKGSTPDMTTLGSFPVMESGGLSVSGASFTSVGDFPELKVLQVLLITDSRQLGSLPELASLEAIGSLVLQRTGVVGLHGIPNMETYSAISPVSYAGYYSASLFLVDNPDLVDIEPLRDVVAVDGYITIHGNRRLCTSYIDEVLEGATATFDVEVSDNGTVGCD